MEADLSRMPTGTTGWLSLVDYARSLGDLSEIDWFELKSSLPFASKSDRKRSAVLLARAVIGMANRMPDAAAKHLSGHGVVLVGIKDSDITGAEQVDGAHLHDALDPYVGQDGLGWDFTFINHPDGLVMAVTVDPPKWGDSIFTFQKEFSDGDTSIRDGEVFVRVPGKTRPATSQDTRELQRRLTASPSTSASVEIQFDGTFDRIHPGAARTLVKEVVDHFADERLGEAEVPAHESGQLSATLVGTAASNSGYKRQRFTSQVEAWRSEAHEKALHVATEFLRHELAQGRLTAINGSDRYLQAVRVQVQFPPEATILIRSDTDYCDHGGQFNLFALLPERPTDFEHFREVDHGFAFTRPRAIPQIPSPSEFNLRTVAGGHPLDLGSGRPASAGDGVER